MEAGNKVEELLQKPEQDQELLDMQRRKSRPKVVFEEYLVDGAEESSDGDAVDLDSAEIKVEQKEEAIAKQSGSDAPPKLAKLKTHIEIEDFALLTDEKAKHVGLAEISPLERHFSSDTHSPASSSADEKK